MYSLYPSPHIVRVIKCRKLRWAGHVARMEEDRSAFNILRDKHIGKRLMGRWEGDIRIDLEEIGANKRN